MRLWWSRLVSWCAQFWRLLRCLYRWRAHQPQGRVCPALSPRQIFDQPKPKRVQQEFIRLKALMPQEPG